MLKLLSIFCVLSISSSVIASNDCSELNSNIQNQNNQIAPVWILLVKAKHRVHFHSAPTKNCKSKDLFIIHGDSVTAYNLYKDSHQQEWVYVMYYSKRQNLESEIVEGWVKLKDFEIIPRSFPHKKSPLRGLHY